MSLSLFSQDRESDSLALVQIYNDLNGDDWVGIDNWLSELPIDEWEGILINNDRVIVVDIKNASATGIFPLSVLELTEIRTLEIRKATISGTIPDEFAELENLSRLVLSDCGMEGELPDVFHLMDNLNTLILDRNSFTGPLPNIQDDLFLVYIDNNQFSGEVPASWENKEIKAIQIQGNQLEGSFDIFSTWPAWKSMNLSDNNWDESTFPEWVTDNEFLQRFDCENCNLTGDLPASLDFSNCPDYNNMQLSDNSLSGDISLLFNGLESEENLYLRARNNNFSGEFPAHKVRLFFRLDVRGNQYESMSDFNDIELESIDINYNNFNFTALEPVKEFIAQDSIVGVLYEYQSQLLEMDSFLITEATILTLQAGDSASNTTYQWYRNNQKIESETNQELILEIDEASNGGSFYCKMNNEDYPELELRRNAVFVSIDIATSISNLEKLDLEVYPNPVTSYLKVRSADNLKNAQYSIFSMNGEEMKKGSLDENEILSVEQLPYGIYTLKIKSDSADSADLFQKFVKL